MRWVAAAVAIFLVLLAAPAHALPRAGAGPQLRLELASVGPRLVTADGPQTLSVSGTITNTGDQAIEDLVVRVQRGEPLATEGAVRDALEGSAGTDAVTPQFLPLADELAPGGQIPVQLSVPLRGAPEAGLALSAPGVYELLVNVNGVPRDGARARLAAVRMLLPVLSLPPDPLQQAAELPNHAAASIGLVYPIADRPRRILSLPGEVLLGDDELATSFAPGGRLFGLVEALGAADAMVRDATCAAVDPDLLETAALMADGYQFRTVDGAQVPGAGAAAAGTWLARLRAVVAGECVIALPYADADLVSLTRNRFPELAGTAVSAGQEVAARALQTALAANTTWPADGLLDEPTGDVLAGTGGRSLLLAADTVDTGRTQRTGGAVPIAGSSQIAVLTDPLTRLAAAGSPPTADPAAGAAAPASSPAGSVGPLSTQDLVGVLAFRAFAGRTGSNGPVLVAPPHQWTADGTGAAELLQAAAQLMDGGRAVPADLRGMLAQPRSDATPVALSYPVRAVGAEVPAPAVDTVRSAAAAITDLASTAVEDAQVGFRPDEVFAPLQRGLARPVSAAWRGPDGAAVQAANLAAARVDGFRASVRVLEPPSPYSLGTTDAPILLTVANGLPVTVRVRVEILPSPGLRVAPIEEQVVPPLGRRQVRVSAEVIRSGQFTVEAAVRSPEGEVLGPPSRLKIRSTAYGTITVWLTGSAGVLLVLLVVRRVVRRVRGRGRPDPGDRHRQPQQPRVPSG